MIDEMTYEQTIELEENIKLKNRAKEIYDRFLKLKLDVSAYKSDGSFVIWKDSHNVIYLTLQNDVFYFQCRFLHETYNVKCTAAGIFEALKLKNRGIDHLICHIPPIK